MSLLSRLISKAVPSAVKPPLAAFFGLAAPNPKSIDFLASYRGWVYACVNAIAESVSATQFRLERKTADGWEEVETHLALDTLHNPNGWETSSDLLFATQSYLELTGESFWYLPKGSATGKPAEIWHLDPTRMNVVRSESSIIGGYVYRAETGQMVPLSTDEIIFHRRFNPLNRFRGMGTVAAAALAIDTDTYAAEWNRNFFFNNATPAGVLSTEGTLSDEQYHRIKAQWEENHGGVANAHKTSVLEAGLKYQAISPHQRDMEFLAQRKFGRDEILGLFKVAPTIVSVNEDINRANAEVGEYNYTKHTVKPKLQFLADRLNQFYLPLFGLDPRVYRFTFEDPVPANVELDLARKTAGITGGWYTINEVREEDGLEPLPDGDVPYISNLLVPLGTPPPQPEQPLDEGKLDEEEEQQPQTGGGAKAFAKQAIEDRLSFLYRHIASSDQAYQALFAQQREELVSLIQAGPVRKGLNKDASVDAARLKDWIRDVVLAHWEKWAPLLAEAIQASAQPVYAAAGARTITQSGINLTFDLKNPRAVAYLKDHALEAATQIADNLKQPIQDILLNGVEQGQSVEEMASAIGQFYDEQSGWRALRIARSEVKAAYGQGSLEGARQAGLEEKSWLTSGVCTHELCLDNQDAGWLGVEDAFPSGDETVPAHSNCECDVLYRMKPNDSI